MVGVALLSSHPLSLPPLQLQGRQLYFLRSLCLLYYFLHNFGVSVVSVSVWDFYCSRRADARTIRWFTPHLPCRSTSPSALKKATTSLPLIFMLALLFYATLRCALLRWPRLSCHFPLVLSLVSSISLRLTPQRCLPASSPLPVFLRLRVVLRGSCGCSRDRLALPLL